MASSSSSRTLATDPLLFEDPALAAALLRLERFGYAIARSISKRNLPYMFMGQAQPLGNGSAQTPHWVWHEDLRRVWRRIHGENQPQRERYEQTRIVSRTKTKLHVSADLRPRISEQLRIARRSLNYTQADLAEVLGCSQDAVSLWERKAKPGRREGVPPVAALTILARIVPEEQRPFWIDAGAIPDSIPIEEKDSRQVPLLRDPAAAGTPRAIDEREVEEWLSFPRRWLPPGGSIFAIKVVGDSMSPTLEDGYIALIDVACKDGRKLVDKMVAARDEDGVTLKWLRKQRDLYLLVPQQTSLDHPVRIWAEGDNKAIVGEVVCWIGRPPTLHGKRK